MASANASKLVEYIHANPSVSSKALHENAGIGVGYATVKRLLSQLVTEGLVQPTGKGRATRYVVGSGFELFYPLDLDDYFLKEIDERSIKAHFNWELLRESLPGVNLFTPAETERLQALQNRYSNNVSQLNEAEYQKELERLAIDLSWKSSQIEGNTYSLLETERLLIEKETAEGKPKDDATMLLNHKETLDFIFANKGFAAPLDVSHIEHIHSLLIKELGVERNIRRRKVGITGTNYAPLDNEFQIREALQLTCELVNSTNNVFEKSLLVLVLLSYIQAFGDGNKRTARIISNMVLIDHGYCPISFRTVSSIEYKKAMLLFYEQNNISAFKQVFMAQFEFAVNTYF
ncbi:MAG: Fic family protein [Pseudomonadales bacterium]|nr:Fic family protein [Pseudomonadales bacterium]